MRYSFRQSQNEVFFGNVIAECLHNTWPSFHYEEKSIRNTRLDTHHIFILLCAKTWGPKSLMCKFCLRAGFLSEATFCEELEIFRNQFWSSLLIAQVVLAFQPNSFLFRVVGYSDADRFIAPKNNRVDMVENNPTHSYMIKGRRVYQKWRFYIGAHLIPLSNNWNNSLSQNFTLEEKTHVFTFALGINVFQA